MIHVQFPWCVCVLKTHHLSRFMCIFLDLCVCVAIKHDSMNFNWYSCTIFSLTMNQEILKDSVQINDRAQLVNLHRFINICVYVCVHLFKGSQHDSRAVSFILILLCVYVCVHLFKGSQHDSRAGSLMCVCTAFKDSQNDHMQFHSSWSCSVCMCVSTCLKAHNMIHVQVPWYVFVNLFKGSQHDSRAGSLMCVCTAFKD